MVHGVVSRKIKALIDGGIDPLVQILQVVFVANFGASHVECVVSVDCGDMPNDGHCQHRGNLRISNLCASGGIYHTKRED